LLLPWIALKWASVLAISNTKLEAEWMIALRLLWTTNVLLISVSGFVMCHVATKLVIFLILWISNCLR
jgi:hypothetical protein